MRLLSIPLIILSLAASAAADSKSGLSQLDFDNVIAGKAPSSNAKMLADVLASDSGETKPAVEHKTARASLSDARPVAIDLTDKTTYDVGYQWKKPLDLSASYLRPAFAGVDTDKDSDKSIKSEKSWAHDNEKSPEQSCERAKAIKEVLARYSGSDEFAAAQCTEACTNKNDTAVLTAFEVKEVNGVTTSTVKADKKSAYQISSTEKVVAWPILEGASGYCSCLPSTCLQ